MMVAGRCKAIWNEKSMRKLFVSTNLRLWVCVCGVHLKRLFISETCKFWRFYSDHQRINLMKLCLVSIEKRKPRRRKKWEETVSTTSMTTTTTACYGEWKKWFLQARTVLLHTIVKHFRLRSSRWKHLKKNKQATLPLQFPGNDLYFNSDFFSLYILKL